MSLKFIQFIVTSLSQSEFGLVVLTNTFSLEVECSIFHLVVILKK